MGSLLLLASLPPQQENRDGIDEGFLSTALITRAAFRVDCQHSAVRRYSVGVRLITSVVPRPHQYTEPHENVGYMHEPRRTDNAGVPLPPGTLYLQLVASCACSEAPLFELYLAGAVVSHCM